MMIDVDNFRSINDQFGHLVGDLTLKSICECLCDTLRPKDILTRFGGDEFVIFLPETRLEQGQSLAERLLNHAALNAVNVEQTSFRCSISIDLTAYRGAFADIDSACATLTQRFMMPNEMGVTVMCQGCPRTVLERNRRQARY